MSDIDWHQRLQGRGLPLSEFVEKWHQKFGWEGIVTCVSMVTEQVDSTAKEGE